MDNNEQIRQEMTKVRQELKSALSELRQEAGKKLKPNELAEVEREFAQIEEFLQRIETGLVWVTLFGKTSVGKSAIANALIGEDKAQVGIQHDLTGSAQHYEKRPWMLVDVPGIMGKGVNEQIAIEEAKKAHGHIFVVDGEPFEDELELFDLVKKAIPDTPKIVFVNKWDQMQNIPKRDREIVRTRIQQKMGKFVKLPATDIIYGSAMIYDPQQDVMVRQELPQLLDRLYSEAGTLGDVMNVLDPAKRAANAVETIRNKVLDVRIRLARKVINGFGIASVAGGFVPFTQLLLAPGILGSMVYAIFQIMGKKQGKDSTNKVTWELLKACAQVLGAEVAAVVLTEIAFDWLAVTTGPLGLILGALADVSALAYYKYRRTVVLGEVTIEYIRHDCSWGAEGQAAVIQRCKERVETIYRLRLAGK